MGNLMVPALTFSSSERGWGSLGKEKSMLRAAADRGDLRRLGPIQMRCTPLLRTQSQHAWQLPSDLVAAETPNHLLAAVEHSLVALKAGSHAV